MSRKHSRKGFIELLLLFFVLLIIGSVLLAIVNHNSYYKRAEVVEKLGKDHLQIKVKLATNGLEETWDAGWVYDQVDVTGVYDFKIFMGVLTSATRATEATDGQLPAGAAENGGDGQQPEFED